MSRYRKVVLAAIVTAGSVLPSPGWADGQSAAPPSQSTAAAQQAGPNDDPDLDFQPLQPDFTLVNLPTTLRLVRHKSAFRVTHRFTRSLNQGDFGSLLEDALSLDSSAQIGLEYRYGIMRGTQIGFRRTNDRTIELFASQSVWQERDGHPVTVSAYAAIDGTNNFRDSYSPTLAAVISRRLGSIATAYVMPTWVNNTNPLPGELVDENDTVLVGIGTRVRIRRTVYLAAEFIPRVGGYDPGEHQASFAIEKVVGGHTFQLNVSNGIASTFAAMARGAESNDNWYLGFNISRKFF